MPPPTPASPTNSTKHQNQGLLRVLLLLVVLAGFLVMYSVTRTDPGQDLPRIRNHPRDPSSDDQNNNDKSRKRKLFLNEHSRVGGKGGKLVDERDSYYYDKNGQISSRKKSDYVGDNDDAIARPPAKKNRLGDGIPPPQGRMFDEHHIDVVRQMVLQGRENNYPAEGVHKYHNVHEDDLEDHIRRDKDEK